MANEITSGIGLKKPAFLDNNWHLPTNENWDLVDSNAGMVPALQKQLSSVEPVDVFIYDTRKDPDGGSWRLAAITQSWYHEELNTATRGVTREFPVVIGIVAEANKVTLYDLTKASAPMWMVFNVVNVNMLAGAGGALVTSVDMLNGVIAVGASLDVMRVDFINDIGNKWLTGFTQLYSGNIEKRNDQLSFTVVASIGIVNRVVNNIDIIWLNERICIAAATDGGVSIIDGPAGIDTVVDITGQSEPITRINFIADNELMCNGQWTSRVAIYDIPAIDIVYTNYNRYYEIATSSIPWLRGNNLQYQIEGAFGTDIFGFTLLAEDKDNRENGMVNYIAKDWQSGWMQGDIRGAWLSDTVEGGLIALAEVDDRSVKNTPLVVTGSNLTRTPVVEGSELVAYSGFSVSDYLEVTNALYASTQFIYGWQENSGVWEFKNGIASTNPIDGVTIVGTTVKVEGTMPKALIRLTAGTPSVEQLTKIEEDELPLFQTNAKCTLQGDSDNVTALDVDPDTDVIYAGTGSGCTAFKGLVAKEITLSYINTDGSVVEVTDGDYSAVSAGANSILHGVDIGTIVNADLISLREYLLKRSKIISIDFVPLDIEPEHKEGRIYYDNNSKAFSAQTDILGTTLNMGQELYIRAVNNTGTTIANGMAVRGSGIDTAEGLVEISLALADTFNHARVLGITTNVIPDGAIGYLTTFGLVHGLDTSAYALGVPLYLSNTVPGTYSSGIPSNNIITQIGGAWVAHATDGVIQTSIQNNIILPTIFGVMQTTSMTPTLSGTHQDVKPYAVVDGKGISGDGTDGTFPLTPGGWFRGTISLTVTAASASPGGDLIQFELWNVTQSAQLFATSVTVDSTNLTASRSAAIPFEVTDGDEVVLRVWSDDNTSVLTFDALSIDIESITLNV